MVRIRMTRRGRTHRPFYRINAVEKRTQRDGKILEYLGWYDPCAKDESKQLMLKEERIQHWISQGAQPTLTVADLLAKNGVMDADKVAAAREKRIGRRRTEIVAQKEADKAAAEAEKKAAAEAAAAEAKAAAEAAPAEAEASE